MRLSPERLHLALTTALGYLLFFLQDAVHYPRAAQGVTTFQIILFPPLPAPPQRYLTVEALYSVAYPLKFLLKKELAIDYPVMPLEGLWWTQDMHTFSLDNKENWFWTMMIMQPEEVTGELFEQTLEQVRKKKASPALAKIRLQRFHEGLAAQIMHLGPFSAEGPTIAKLHAFIHDQGYEFDGIEQKHHEIYLSDPRRAVPAKMRTVIRQPVLPSPTRQKP